MTDSGAAPSWRTASGVGARRVNADSAAVRMHAPATLVIPVQRGGEDQAGPVAVDAGPVMLFAVADGVGDTPAAARAALLAAGAAVRDGGDDPVDAVLAAQAAVLADPAAGDCVLAVARVDRAEARIAWVGDTRVWSYGAGGLRQLTTDHTLAELFRAQGVTGGSAHMVTTSVRSVKRQEIGSLTVAAPATLLLTSDGVHRPLGDAGVERALRSAKDPARALVDDALAAGGRDNATALVATFPADLPTAALPLPS